MPNWLALRRAVAREIFSNNANRRITQTLNTRTLGDHLGHALVFDRRVGGSRFSWSKQDRVCHPRRDGSNADDLLASCLRRDTARPRLPYRQLPRERKTLIVTDDHRDRVDHSCLWLLNR